MVEVCPLLGALKIGSFHPWAITCHRLSTICIHSLTVKHLRVFRLHSKMFYCQTVNGTHGPYNSSMGYY